MGLDPRSLSGPDDSSKPSVDPDLPGEGDRERQPLADLAAGRWSLWTGLAPSATLEDVEVQLGPSMDAEPHGGMFGGHPTMFRRWDPRPSAPRGLILWFEGVVVVGVELRGANRDPDDPALPDPDLVLDSGLGGTYRQYVWGERGLVVHRALTEGTAAALLLGRRPFDPATWESHPLRWWSRTRHRR